jgi:hypothetical protein
MRLYAVLEGSDVILITADFDLARRRAERTEHRRLVSWEVVICP